MTPNKLTLEADKTYLYCTCGKSKDITFCDGSHRETHYKPLKFTVDEKGTYNLCRCKKTKNPPYCDGSHRA